MFHALPGSASRRTPSLGPPRLADPRSGRVRPATKEQWPAALASRLPCTKAARHCFAATPYKTNRTRKLHWPPSARLHDVFRSIARLWQGLNRRQNFCHVRPCFAFRRIPDIAQNPVGVDDKGAATCGPR